ncbi:hypothetical protein H1C71_033728 [Ictidomys tridecemlineatus]|nr:hypothetical protein H1C71_033728 [Ictidomys tridecemlineatus]
MGSDYPNKIHTPEMSRLGEGPITELGSSTKLRQHKYPLFKPFADQVRKISDMSLRITRMNLLKGKETLKGESWSSQKGGRQYASFAFQFYLGSQGIFQRAPPRFTS